MLNDDFMDHINPVTGSRPVEGMGERRQNERRRNQPQSIAGRVVAIHRGTRRGGEGHMLDVSVGGDEFTEIVLRVPAGAYGNIEGKRAVLYIDE